MSSQLATARSPRPQFYQRTKRGDTIIELMFAIAVFALVAVIAVSVMNLGTATAENALEVVTARNELNAQAEALRFVHSSYISERTLPTSDDPSLQPGGKYQQYNTLWEAIISHAIKPDDARAAGFFNLADSVTGHSDTAPVGCARVYENNPSSGRNLLSQVNAFVLNTRNLSSRDAAGNADLDISYVSSRTQPEVFRESELNARIIYTADTSLSDENSDSQLNEGDIIEGTIYDRILWAEGIWVVAVTDGASDPANSAYFDFYIQTCWYGPNATSPTALDTVIRLYNPEGA